MCKSESLFYTTRTLVAVNTTRLDLPRVSKKALMHGENTAMTHTTNNRCLLIRGTAAEKYNIFFMASNSLPHASVR